MTNEQVKHMVDRFLGWRLPEDFHPDAGISFAPDFNMNTPHPMKHRPTGTNLFTATQADAMIRYMIDGIPPAAAPVVETASAPTAQDGAKCVCGHYEYDHVVARRLCLHGHDCPCPEFRVAAPPVGPAPTLNAIGPRGDVVLTEHMVQVFTRVYNLDQISEDVGDGDHREFGAASVIQRLCASHEALRVALETARAEVRRLDPFNVQGRDSSGVGPTPTNCPKRPGGDGPCVEWDYVFRLVGRRICAFCGGDVRAASLGAGFPQENGK